MNFWLQLKMHGVHVPHHKNTADLPAVIMDCPKSVTIPMSMHIGTPARPLVKVGEYVKMGQRIAEADGFVSSPVHASISGTVKKIDLAANIVEVEIARGVVIKVDKGYIFKDPTSSQIAK